MTWRDTFSSLSTEDKIAAAILIAWPTVKSPGWRRWALGWLTGEDRSMAGAEVARLFTIHGDLEPYFLALGYGACSLASSDPDSNRAAWFATFSKWTEQSGVDPSPVLDEILEGRIRRCIELCEQEMLDHAS